MNTKSVLGTICLCFAVSGCGSSVGLKVTQLSMSQTVDHRGVTYTLPRTEITVRVPVTRITITPGQFYKDLEDIENQVVECGQSSATELQAVANQRKNLCDNLAQFGFKSRIKGFKPTDVIRFKLGKPSVDTRSIQDPDHIYMVSIESGDAEDVLLSMAFEELGFLSTATSERNDRRIELSAKAFETVASLALSAVPFGAGFKGLTGAPSNNLYVKANYIFSRIRDVRMTRTSIYNVANSANLSVSTLKHAREELDKLEAALLSSFVKKNLEIFTATYVFTPTKIAAGSEELFAMNGVKGATPGICRESRKLNTPMPKTFLSPIACTNGQDNIAIGVRVKNDSAATASVLSSINYDDGNPELGLRYRVPGLAKLDIVQKLGQGTPNPTSRHEIVVAQFGEAMALPAKPGGTKTKIVMHLFAKTGALKQFEVTSTAAAAAAIEGLGTVGNAAAGIVDVRRAAREKEEQESSEKAQLQNEVDLLKLKKEKADLEKALAELNAEGA